MSDVLLVSVPYAALQHPSPALGCLQASLLRRGIHVRTFHANLQFARRIGIGNYAWFGSYGRPQLLGEFTFAKAAFPAFEPDLHTYVEALNVPGVEKAIRDIRDAAVSFIDEMAEHIVGLRPKIVGCSSTFQQNCASLALLRRIREVSPEIVTVMGGANCENEMGRALHTNFNWIDYVVSGDAEDVFPELCDRILHRDIHGFQSNEPLSRYVFTPATRPFNKMRPIGRATIQNMDALPLPDYDDYFQALADTKIDRFATPGLLVQTARGCWWGEKHPCTFCGLNGGCMSFRAMSAESAERLICGLSDRYGIDGAELIDNILEPSYFRTVLPSLARKPKRLRLACEVKANLTREQVKLLADSGMTWVQPGIESLNDETLRLIDKGTTLCQNLQLLKWAREYGVHITWNYLMGIPGESREAYTEVASLVPLLVHLQAPNGPGSRLSFDRFSVYHSHADHYQLTLRPAWGYSYVYPLPLRELMDLAYHFDDTSPGADQRRFPEQDLLRKQLVEWCDLQPEPSAFDRPGELPPLPRLDVFAFGDGRLLVEDTRPCALQSQYEISGLAAYLYTACDRGRNAAKLLPESRADGFPETTARDIDRELTRLIESKLMVLASGRFLSLAVRAPYPPLRPLDEHPDGQVYLEPVRNRRKPREQTIEDVFMLEPAQILDQPTGPRV